MAFRHPWATAFACSGGPGDVVVAEVDEERLQKFKAFNEIDHVPSNIAGRDRITILSCPVGVSPKGDLVPFCPVGLTIIMSCAVERN